MQSLVEEGGMYGIFTRVVVYFLVVVFYYYFFFGGGGGGGWWVYVRASAYVHVYVDACV